MPSASGWDHPVGVAIRSERRLYRDVLAAWLANQLEFTVVGHVAGDADLLELCRLRSPELVLFDAATGVHGSLGSLRELRARSGASRVVLVYERLSAGELAAAGRVGVERLVPCSHGLPALLAVLHEYAQTVRSAAGSPGSSLTEHEREVLTLVATGHQVDRIAELLSTSPHAVEHSKRRIYAKLHAVNQSHAIARAAALGLLGSATGAAGGLPELTARESQILRSIAAGDTVRQTARSLGIAPKTVENTQARLFRKLGCRNRAATLARALDLGLLDPPMSTDRGARRAGSEYP